MCVILIYIVSISIKRSALDRPSVMHEKKHSIFTRRYLGNIFHNYNRNNAAKTGSSKNRKLLRHEGTSANKTVPVVVRWHYRSAQAMSCGERVIVLRQALLSRAKFFQYRARNLPSCFDHCSTVFSILIPD